MTFPTWVPGLDLLTGEAVDDRLCRFVRTLNGVSLSNRVDVLRALVNRTVSPDSLREWEWQTNCAESAIGILAAACATPDCARQTHPLLMTPGVIGSSISRVFQMGRDLGVMRPYKPGDPPPARGSLVSYAHGAHVEWILSDVDANGIADHGGGGRPGNAITVGRGDIRTSWGRPLTEVFYFPPVLPPSPEAASGELERASLGDEYSSENVA